MNDIREIAANQKQQAIGARRVALELSIATFAGGDLPNASDDRDLEIVRRAAVFERYLLEGKK